MNLFAKAREWLAPAVQAAAGVSVTYTRGATSVSLTPVPGRTVFVSNAEGAPRVEFGERDYLIPVSELTALGVPKIGDRIAETIDGVTVTFEVQQPNAGEPAWRYDQTRSVFRVHCKRPS